MTRILVSAGLLFSVSLAICGPALAEDGNDMYDMAPQLAHWAITILGTAVAARLALQAFGHAVPVANVPTFPIYMTSRQQYRLGGWTFGAFACGFFLLLIHEHQQVIELIKPFDIIPDNIIEAVSKQSAPYLAIVAAMGAAYLYCLTYEKPWNVLLMMRDVIQSWISVPQLAKQIIAQIQFSLHVPREVVSDVIAASNSVVVEQDFRKDVNTPDRKWAETCYMKWWLTRGLDAGGDATFFTEESFAFNKLVDDFVTTSPAIASWKSGSAADLVAQHLPQTVDDLHRRFSRLVACYLIYRNGSKKELSREAFKFGITLSDETSENPLRYWIVYMIALMGSVYVGVHASAIGFDLVTGQGWQIAQDPNLALKWVMYTASNFGLAIIVILLLRLLARSLERDVGQSHLVTYCWTFLIAFLVGSAGLTVAGYFFAPSQVADQPLYLLYSGMLKWGLGSALVCVYVSYYLDRQTYADLPDIVHSFRTLGWRLVNCFGFAAATLVLLLPALLALRASAEVAPWNDYKLRFVASGTTFCVTFGLALAAQFALRKAGEGKAAAPVSAGGEASTARGGYNVSAFRNCGR
jgi:hypothetical protein